MKAIAFHFNVAAPVPYLCRLLRKASHAEQVPPQTAAHWPLLINLLAPLPEGWQGFARLIEIVPQDEALKQAARERWRSYAGQGRRIERHDASQASATPAADPA